MESEEDYAAKKDDRSPLQTPQKDHHSYNRPSEESWREEHSYEGSDSAAVLSPLVRRKVFDSPQHREESHSKSKNNRREQENFNRGREPDEAYSRSVSRSRGQRGSPSGSKRDPSPRVTSRNRKSPKTFERVPPPKSAPRPQTHAPGRMRHRPQPSSGTIYYDDDPDSV